MSSGVTILCPVDLSLASSSALRYGIAIAEHFAARLLVFTVVDFRWAAALQPDEAKASSEKAARQELEAFVERTPGTASSHLARCEYSVATGTPALEILRVARERSCDLVVISSRGLTGLRKAVLGSTTEHVLRETTVPVLVIPQESSQPSSLEDVLRHIGRIVVPVDLSPFMHRQAQAAGRLAEALGIPVVLVHVIERVARPIAGASNIARLEAEWRSTVEGRLRELAHTALPFVHVDVVIRSGDPAKECARVTRELESGLVVVALHGGSGLGPRMGSVTHRLLCLAPTSVLALPPGLLAPVKSGSLQGGDGPVGVAAW